MSFYTTFSRLDNIPVNDYGYVITMDGTIHSLKYKFSHAYIVCLLFKDKLESYGLSLDKIDIDNATYNTGMFPFDMPCIRVARYMPHDKGLYEYDLWYNKNISKEMLLSLHHIMYNVYGIDGSETVDSPIMNPPIYRLGELISFLKTKRKYDECSPY